eukprot:TRINITY_DN5196_c0_g1_i2.p1 TRINITY_DN5196_c0_g1~~TRINITY_DN5196_c0_g1_i2.p1  ORF type:complete len:155 (-),score=59.63 TRINITY_DN5196_c0_g1_i2:43-447(-)
MCIRDSYKPPPMQVIHIPKLSKPENPIMVNELKNLCHSCSPDYQAKLRIELQKRVFQPGGSLPTMTLEEFAEKEMERMRITEEQTKAAQLRSKEEEEEDSDREEIDAKRTKKARDWDDWKDDHEKGAGNKLKNR